MQVTAYAAVSVDGFIAKENGDTDWVLDDGLFEETCKEYECVTMGRATYDEFGGPPFEGVKWIILSGKSRPSKNENVDLVTSAQKAIEWAETLGFEKLLVIGGAKTYHSFLQTGAVQKLLLDVHPIVLGDGIRLFDSQQQLNRLKLLSDAKYSEGFVHLEYELVGA